MKKLKQSAADPKSAKMILLGVPWDENSTFMQGPSLAPPVIRKAFHCDSTNTWSESGLDLGVSSFFYDTGDLIIENDALVQIEKKVTTLGAYEKPVLVLGGDHAVTYPVVKGLSAYYPKLNILHFDAHPDLYDSLDGNRYSHACPFARIMEEGLCDRLVQVGIRGMNGHQREQAARFGVEVHEMKDFQDSPQFSFNGPLFISFDMDALDPAFAPGVSHFEPGGFSTRQVIQIIQSLTAPKIVGADIVEYNPKRDIEGVTGMVASKLMKELAARMVEI